MFLLGDINPKRQNLLEKEFNKIFKEYSISLNNSSVSKFEDAIHIFIISTGNIRRRELAELSQKFNLQVLNPVGWIHLN